MRAALRTLGVHGPRLALAAIALGALGLCGLFAARWSAGEINAWGWDESMHAALPGARIALAAEARDWRGALEAVHDCERYPPVTGLVLAGPMWVFGPSELVARTTLLLAWLALGIGGLVLLGREVGRATGRGTDGARGRIHVTACGAAACALASPLANRYAPTLFLESLFAAFAVLAVWAYLRARRPGAGLIASLGAGTLIALVFFTKWNYGVLFLAALGVDACIDLLGASRRGALPAAARRLAWLALPLALACAWWFWLPWPFGGGVAARHRAEFYDYLGSNQEMGKVVLWMRGLALYRGVAPHPALLVLLVLGALRSIARVSVPDVRTLWLLLLIIGVPASTHEFFLDRFLLVPGLLLFVLAACGWAEVLAGGRIARGAAALIGVAALATWAAVPTFDVAVRLGLEVNPSPAVAEYQRAYVEQALGPFGPPAANGLPRASHEDLLERVARAVGPTERVGWVGQSQEVSPASLHFGLLERGGAPARFRADAEGPMDLWPVPTPKVEPPIETEAILAWATGFDALILCTPVDLKGRAHRAWVADAWQAPLLAAGWRAVSLGAVEIGKPPGPPASVEVRLARRE